METIPGRLISIPIRSSSAAAVEAFLNLGAAKVLVAEGPGHVNDTLLVLEESGIAEILWEDKIPFVDLNYDQTYTIANAGKFSRLKTLTLPAVLQQVDFNHFSGQAEDAPLGGCHAVSKKSLWRHAGNHLWLAQKCSASCRY